MLLLRVQTRRDELLNRPLADAVTDEDRNAFNVLLSVARRERSRDVLIRSLAPVHHDQQLDRARLIDRYDRLALALGEGAQRRASHSNDTGPA